MRWIIIGLIAGSALVAGCSKQGGTTSSAPAAAPAAAPASAPGPAAFLGRPHPKAGLWRTTINTNIGPGVSMTGQLCLDASNEDAAFSTTGRGVGKECDPVKYQSAAGGFGFTTVCHLGRRTVTTTGVASGDFNTNYSMDITTHSEPSAPGAPNQIHTSIQAKWEGPCPAGTKPGMKVTGFGQG